MSSLLDTLDRFNFTLSSINSTLTTRSNDDLGPFTSAMLHAPLQEIIREADETEYGLFTFVTDSASFGDNGLNQGKVGRKEFRGATPLKARRPVGTTRDEEPEVYLNAALKYMERFQMTKPMPHVKSRIESLIGRVNQVRDNLARLQDTLHETERTGRTSPQSQIAEEERRISELKSRTLQLRKRKEALSSKLPPKDKPGFKPNVRSRPKIHSPSDRRNSDPPTSSRKPASAGINSKVPIAKTQAIQSTTTTKPDTYEDDDTEKLFWSGRKPDTLRNVDSLLSEELDMTGMDSIMSPSPLKKKSSARSKIESVNRQSAIQETQIHDEGDNSENDSDSGEPTIIISKLIRASEPPSSKNADISVSPLHQKSDSHSSNIEPQTPNQLTYRTNSVVPPSTGKGKVRRIRITAEVERICAKIWSTIADLLVPGNNFLSPGSHYPSAKDTIAVLQALADQPIPNPSSGVISSPSTHSTLSSILGIELVETENSPHQIMTALVLLSLFKAPNHSMALTALKAILAAKTAVPALDPDATPEQKQAVAAMEANNAQLGTRTLYGCRAKKLIKIDRTSTEQVVKFGV